MRSLETFNELHSTAATGAWRWLDRRDCVIIDLIAVCAFEVTSWRIEQAAAQRQFVGAMTIGKQPVVTNTIEPVRQDVKQKTADELASGERHGLAFCLSLLAVVLPAEGNMLIGEFDEPAVADSDAVGIAREIGRHLLWPSERALGKDHPFALATRRETGYERRAIRVRGEIVEEL